jgi:hypothetical protein
MLQHLRTFRLLLMHSSRLGNKVSSLSQSFFLFLKKDLTDGITGEERYTGTISR